ncbi:hypothetical protein ACFXQA_14760 [Microbacterium sp. P07]|uniref:hypothetical protein n=1 Tax=Microbacterium sp. P07 TaxID=3366952 RepID=UPI003745ED21
MFPRTPPLLSSARTLRPAAALGMFAAGALLLAGCATGPQPVDPAVSSVPTDAASPRVSESTDAVATGNDAALAAIATAENETGGIAYEIDLDDEDFWEVHLAVGDTDVEVRTTADGASVRSTDTDDTLDDDDRDAVDAADVTLIVALQAAVVEHGADSRGGGALVDEITVSDDAGPIAWEVSFEDDVDVYVNVVDGAIIRLDR